MSLPIGPQLLHGGLYLALYARVLPRTIGVAEVVGDPELLERLIKVLHVLRTVVRLDPHHREGRVIQKLSQEDLRVARGPGSEYPAVSYSGETVDGRELVVPGTPAAQVPVSYTHLRAHETRHDLVCRLLLE